jgi:hypothetical protein
LTGFPWIIWLTVRPDIESTDQSGVPKGTAVAASTFTVMAVVNVLKLAVSVAVPGANAASWGGSLGVMLTTVGSLIVQIAFATGWPASPTRLTVRVCPTVKVARTGAMKMAFGGTTGIALKVTESGVPVMLPAMSAACTRMELAPETRVTLQAKEPEVSVAGEPLQVTEATPDKLSETEPASWSAAALTEAPFAGEEILMTGGVWSIFRLVVVLALFPALSKAVPKVGWFDPSDETVTGDGHTATPDNVSAQLKLTVTAELFHPAAFGAGFWLAAMVGGVLSILI